MIEYTEQEVIGFVLDIQPLVPNDLGRLAVNTARMQWDACNGMGYTASRAKHYAELATEVGLHPTPGPAPNPLPFTPFKGAFCIPDALPGIPYGDGKRIWTPAFGCYDATWQDRMIDQTLARRYPWLEYQVSGKPYRDDYPELDTDPARVRRDLLRLRQRGIRNIIAFDDRREDLSYLEPIAAVTQDLVDCTMGIYEVNGVFAEPNGTFSAKTYARVEAVLKRTKELWPNAINAFHSTTQDNGGLGFGEKDFWDRMAPYVDVYFLQQSAWEHTPADTANRAQDFTSRLQGGLNGWHVLKYGVVLFEETTSKTYRGSPESYGVNMTNDLLNRISPRPTGFMDGGS